MFPVGKVDGKIDTSDERKAFDSVDDETEEKKESPDEEGEPESEGSDEDSEEDPNEESDEDDSNPDEESEDEDSNKENEEEQELETQDSLYQQIKKTSPELFKKIPELKKVIFREQAFTELFPTIDDAKVASESLEIYNQLQTDIISGDSEKLLSALDKIDREGDVKGKSLQEFAANFIPTLEKVSKDLYLGILYPEFKKMLRAATKSGNKTLSQSAENINWFIFGEDGGTEKDAGLKAKVKDEREESFSKRERELENRLFNGFMQDTAGVTKGRTLRFISSAFKDSGLSEWQQKKLTDDIFARLDISLSRDVRHMGQINQLYKEARRAGFTSEYKDRIVNTYLSRAKLLIPKIRQAVLSEAKVQAKINSQEPKKKATRITGTGASKPVGREKVDPKKVDWEKTSERDLLDGKFTERK